MPHPGLDPDQCPRLPRRTENDELFTDDGWLLMGDIVEIDRDGWLTVVGRTSDFIIRGGQNISAPAVENEVSAHPAIRLA